MGRAFIRLGRVDSANLAWAITLQDNSRDLIFPRPVPRDSVNGDPGFYRALGFGPLSFNAKFTEILSPFFTPCRVSGGKCRIIVPSAVLR